MKRKKMVEYQVFYWKKLVFISILKGDEGKSGYKSGEKYHPIQ